MNNPVAISLYINCAMSASIQLRAFLLVVRNTNEDFKQALMLSLQHLNGSTIHTTDRALVNQSLSFVKELLSENWDDNKQRILRDLHDDLTLGAKMNLPFDLTAYLSRMTTTIPSCARAKTAPRPKPKGKAAADCTAIAVRDPEVEPPVATIGYEFNGEWFPASADFALRPWVKQRNGNDKMQVNSAKACKVSKDSCTVCFVYCDKCPKIECPNKCKEKCKQCRCPYCEKSTLMRNSTAKKMIDWRPHLPEIIDEWIVVKEQMGAHRGGESQAHINKQKRVLRKIWAEEKNEDPSMLYHQARNNPDIPDQYIPEAASISKRRTKHQRLEGVSENQGESPAEFEALLLDWLKKEGQPSWVPYILPDVTETSNCILAAATSRYQLETLAAFAVEGVSLRKKKQVLKVVGDFTHTMKQAKV